MPGRGRLLTRDPGWHVQQPFAIGLACTIQGVQARNGRTAVLSPHRSTSPIVSVAFAGSSTD